MKTIKSPAIQLKMPKEQQNTDGFDNVIQFYNMVKEFHEVFNHPIETKEVTPELLSLRANLIREEAKEGIKALEENDNVELLDAAGDVIYVTAGTLVAIKGALAGATTVKLHKGSLHWKVLSAAVSTYKDDFKVAFEHALEIAKLLDKAADYLKRRKDEKANIELGTAVYAIGDSLLTFDHILVSLGINNVEMVKAIHESNMSKLWSGDINTRLNQITNCKYDPDDLAFNVCSSRDGMIGYRISDGKILKSPSYTPVDLGCFVADCEIMNK